MSDHSTVRATAEQSAGRNRPTIAAAVTGAVTALTASLAHWAVAALPDLVPSDVRAGLLGVLLLAGVIIGGVAGRLAQRHTWAEGTVLDRQADWWQSGFTAARRAADWQPGETDADPTRDLASGKALTPMPDPLYQHPPN